MSWAALGEMLVGGGRQAEQDAYDDQTLSRARIDDAMTRAAIARDRRRAREAVRSMTAEELMADAALGEIMLADLGGNYSGVMQGRNRGQEHGFRETIADPTLPTETRQGALVALGRDPYSRVGSHTYAPRVGGDAITTPLGEEMIEYTDARTGYTNSQTSLNAARTDATAALAESRRDRTANPERYRSSRGGDGSTRELADVRWEQVLEEVQFRHPDLPLNEAEALAREWQVNGIPPEEDEFPESTNEDDGGGWWSNLFGGGGDEEVNVTGPAGPTDLGTDIAGGAPAERSTEEMALALSEEENARLVELGREAARSAAHQQAVVDQVLAEYNEMLATLQGGRYSSTQVQQITQAARRRLEYTMSMIAPGVQITFSDEGEE